MLWLKALHVVFVVTWFAGLFYLPRLYVYHAQASDSISTQRFEIMERRLFAIMTMGAAASILFGGLMLIESPAYLQMTWLKVKLLFVALVIAYHAYCYKLMRDFATQRNTHSSKWFRAFNEVPSLLLIVIVILAVVKPG
ncbi:MAG TPA: protoporphyrinogen oxidase HemJ [Steroidobacteraceae bacterium]|jgi:protoporphyrinogen IX oxidase|nr:protoporphyrinogen oxidase HemJ [Steroidobacteraceae bacterium]